MSDEGRGDLAKIGVSLEDDGDLWRLTLRALGSPPGDVDPLSTEHRDHVAAQVHSESDRDNPVTVEFSRDFVRTFVDVYDLGDLSDVNDLLGREQHERTNYEGQLAFERDRSEEEAVDSILDKVGGDDDRDDPGRDEWGDRDE